jgi:hypothetical protein
MVTVYVIGNMRCCLFDALVDPSADCYARIDSHAAADIMNHLHTDMTTNDLPKLGSCQIMI